MQKYLALGDLPQDPAGVFTTDLCPIHPLPINYGFAAVGEQCYRRLRYVVLTV